MQNLAESMVFHLAQRAGRRAKGRIIKPEHITDCIDKELSQYLYTQSKELQTEHKSPVLNIFLRSNLKPEPTKPKMEYIECLDDSKPKKKTLEDWLNSEKQRYVPDY